MSNRSSTPPSSGASFSNLTSFGLQEFDNFSGDAFFSDFDLLVPLESSDKSTTATSELESTQLNTAFNIDQFAMSPRETDPTVPLQASTAPVPPALDSIATSCNTSDGTQVSLHWDTHKMKMQYPHIHALSRMIEILESYVANKNAAVDEVLRINQSYMAEITNIMEQVQAKLCNSCPMLMLTAMELMLALYENAIFPGVRKRKDSSSTPSSPPPTPANNLPNLQFGVFIMEPHEKIAFGNRIICKELQRYTQVIKELSSEWQSGGENFSFGIVRMRWMVELESRVETFIKTLQD